MVSLRESKWHPELVVNVSLTLLPNQEHLFFASRFSVSRVSSRVCFIQFHRSLTAKCQCLFSRAVVPSCLFASASRAYDSYTYIYLYHLHGSNSFFEIFLLSNVFLNHQLGDTFNDSCWCVLLFTSTPSLTLPLKEVVYSLLSMTYFGILFLDHHSAWWFRLEHCFCSAAAPAVHLRQFDFAGRLPACRLTSILRYWAQSLSWRGYTRCIFLQLFYRILLACLFLIFFALFFFFLRTHFFNSRALRLSIIFKIFLFFWFRLLQMGREGVISMMMSLLDRCFFLPCSISGLNMVHFWRRKKVCETSLTVLSFLLYHISVKVFAVQRPMSIFFCDILMMLILFSH